MLVYDTLTNNDSLSNPNMIEEKLASVAEKKVKGSVLGLVDPETSLSKCKESLESNPTVQSPEIVIDFENDLGKMEATPLPNSNPSLIDVKAILNAVKRINYSHLRPVGLMKVPVSFAQTNDNQCWDALVDSGGDVNLLREDVVSKLGIPWLPCGGMLKGFGTREGTILGTITLIPILHGREFKQTKFMVVPEFGLTETVVLGSDFFINNGILVDNGKNCLSTVNAVDGSRWDFYVSDEGFCRQMYYGLRVTAAESVHLKSGEPVLVPISVEYPIGQLSFQCSSCVEKDRSIYFYDSCHMAVGLESKVVGISGLMSGEESSVLLKSETSAWTKKGDLLGRMYSVLVVDTPEGESENGSISPDDAMIQAVSDISLSEDLQPEQKEEFRNMLLRHLPVISRGDEDVGECADTPIKIHLYDETPIFQRPRRFSPPITEAIEQQCQELHSLDIIEPSISPWSSPVVPVIKPDKSIRLCVDYRKLNKVTIADRFPMVNLADSVFGLHGIKYFTSLDLVRGYYQLPLHEDSKKFTAFSTAYGHWQFKRLSFGLKNAPAVFQREMQRILNEFPKCKVIVYIDDILILGHSFEEHLKLVDRVLALLQKYGLKIKLSKCSWAQIEVKFLGHLVSRSGLRKHPDYIHKIKDFKPPSTVHELRKFLGFVNFQRKFIPLCSVIAKPLSSLTGGRKSQGKQKLLWTEEMNNAFEKLKEVLQREIFLAYPDYSHDAKPLELYVDASGEGAGACLCQEQDGNRLIIAFDSMTFLDYETRYSTIERELAALRWGVKTFRPFLYGQFFIIYSDHRPLMYLQDMKMIDSRLSRTLEELSEYDFVVRYCPGELNTAADWLSRLPGLPSRELVSDESYLKLPVGLKVMKEVKGGPDSLVNSLVCCLEQIYEEQGNDLSLLPTGTKLRENMVDQFLKDSAKLGFKLDKVARNRIRAMRYSGCVPALELLLAFSKCFGLQVWLHYGPTYPVVYCHSDVNDGPIIHIQCLGGVHFNPVSELKNFVLPSKVFSGSKLVWKLPDRNDTLAVDIDEEVNVGESETPEILYTTEVEGGSQLRCNHAPHPSRCQVWVNGVVFCALIDTGAQVSVVSESVLSESSLSNFVETQNEGGLVGITGETSIDVGSIMLTLKFSNGFEFPEFPYAVIPSHGIDFCFIVGRNILVKSNIVIDFSHGRLFVDGVVVSRFIDFLRACYVASVGSSEAHLNANVMSVVCGDDSCFHNALISFDELREIQGTHRQLQRIIKMVQSGISSKNLPRNLYLFKRNWSNFEVHDNLLFKRGNNRLVSVITFNCLVGLVMSTHLQQCHLGIFKLSTLLKKFVWHHSLLKVVRDVCRTCSICQMCKVSCQVVVPPTLRITTSGPFDLVAIDLISLPTTSTGYVGCLMVVDHFSKWVIAIPIRNKKSQTICQVLERNVLPNIPRMPVRILTDNGPEFISKEFTLTLERYNIVHVRSTPYKASSNGAVERVNRTIGELLRILTNEPCRWDESLASALLSYNHSVHSEIGCTPAECILKIPHNVDSVPLLSAETRNPWAEGHPRYQAFKVGTLVLRKVKLLGNLTINKLVPRFDGPYRIVTVNPNKVTYDIIRLSDDVVIKAHHVQLKSWCEPPWYLKRHAQFYGSPVPGPFDSNDTDYCIADSGVGNVSMDENSTCSDKDSDSDSDFPPVPMEVVRKFFERRNPPPVVKSILKPPRTFESKLREKALTLFEMSHGVLDSTPVLSPVKVGLTEEPNCSLVSTPCLSGTTFDQLSHVERGDISVLSVSREDVYEANPASYCTNEGIMPLDWDISPIKGDPEFRFPNSVADLDSDSSSKVESSDLQLLQLFEEKKGMLGETRSSKTEEGEVSVPGSLALSEVTSADFSGFSVTPPQGTFNSSPVRVTSVVRTYQAIKDAVSVMQRDPVFPSSVLSSRLSLSPVYKELYEAREMISKFRKRARDRAIKERRRLSYSPPFTRSRGKVVPLPNVLPHALERKNVLNYCK